MMDGEVRRMLIKFRIKFHEKGDIIHFIRKIEILSSSTDFDVSTLREQKGGSEARKEEEHGTAYGANED